MSLRCLKEPQPVSAISFENCFAKTDENGNGGVSVLEHCRNVGEVARILAASLPTAVLERLSLPPELVAALHDIGKVSPGFQLKYFCSQAAALAPDLARRTPGSFETDHARVGASAIWRRLGDGFECPALAQIVAIHHGAIRVAPSHSDTGEIFGGRTWSEQRDRLIRTIEEIFGQANAIAVAPVVRNCLAGLATVADWIGSDESFFPAAGLPNGACLAQVAAKAVEACGFRKPQIRSGLSFVDLFGFSPYPLQSQFADAVAGPGLYVLEAPMGMGKTEAALFAAYRLMQSGHNNGLFFGLPTRLTSDRIHQRVEAFLEQICPDFLEVKLAHGTAWLRQFEAGGEDFRPGHPWFNPRKRALLHPFVVGTIDQALFSVLRVKHYFVRTFALAGKVVILDEVHSYDGYTGSLLDDMVKELLEIGCTVIVLSATLTVERRAAFFSPSAAAVHASNDYPLLSCQIAGQAECHAVRAPASRPYQVHMAVWDSQAVATAAIDRARAGQCVLAIANSVAQAQNWYAEVAASMNQAEFPVGLLHSKFPFWRRSEIESDWLACLGKPGGTVKRPAGCVLVATQVVEQSVDIDADYLITELAPTDMLLQRMGRLWRHERGDRSALVPETVIVTDDPGVACTVEEMVEKLGKVNALIYAPYVLWRTYCVWRGRSVVCLPGDIRELLEATYCNVADATEVVGELHRRFVEQRDKLVQIARAARATVAAMPMGEDKEGVATRYSDLPTIQALLVKAVDSIGSQAEITLLDGKKLRVSAWQTDFAATAILHANLVNLATYLLGNPANLKPLPFLARHFCETTPVLVWEEGSGELRLDGRPTGLMYTPTYGVARCPPQGERPGSFASEYDDCDVFDKSRFDW